jgi:hypothetical protein
VEQLLLVGVLVGCLTAFIAAWLWDRRRAHFAARAVAPTADESDSSEPGSFAGPAHFK